MHLSLSPTERRHLDAIQRMSPDAKSRWLDNQARLADEMHLDRPPRGLTTQREMVAMKIAGKRQRLERICYLNECALIGLELAQNVRNPPKKRPLLEHYRDRATALWGSAAAYKPPERRPFIANGIAQPGLAWERDHRAPTGWRLIEI